MIRPKVLAIHYNINSIVGFTELLLSIRTKAIHDKQKLIASMFHNLMIFDLCILLDTRKAERVSVFTCLYDCKRTEVKDNLPEPQKRVHERDFSLLFSNQMKQQLGLLECPHSFDACPVIIVNRKSLVLTLFFLIEKIRQAQLSVEHKLKTKQLVGQTSAGRDSFGAMSARDSNESFGMRTMRSISGTSFMDVNEVVAKEESKVWKEKYDELLDVFQTMTTHPMHSNVRLLQSQNYQLQRRVSALEEERTGNEEIAYG